MLRPFAYLLVLCTTSILVRAAAAEEARLVPWSAEAPDVVADVAAGRPVVVRVVVALCSNDQIDCGGTAAGDPGNLERNLYWGAIFGARRFFDRKRSGWERVAVSRAAGLLERVIYRRHAAAARWGLDGGTPIEQLVVLDAVHGDAIDEAVTGFYRSATSGGHVTFDDAGRRRTERVHVTGYVGHNRLMDGTALPRPGTGAPTPSFVLACYSESYFSQALKGGGSAPLVTTRALMAPEGYVLDALVRSLGDNEPRARLRHRVVAAYAKWQRLSFREASAIFAR